MTIQPEKTIVVASGIIFKDSKILIAQRKKHTILEPNKWEFPGGQIEFSETPEECLKREIKEELGIEISVDEIITVRSHVHNINSKRYHVILLFYRCRWLKGIAKAIDCQDFRWTEKKDLKDYNFVPLDKDII
jgi:8-oxo-dGTP diphosphatase